MKLIFCKKCTDLRKMHRQDTLCYCGESGGRYLADGLHVEVWGRYVEVVAVNNYSIAGAVNRNSEKDVEHIISYLVRKSDRIKKIQRS